MDMFAIIGTISSTKIALLYQFYGHTSHSNSPLLGDTLHHWHGFILLGAHFRTNFMVIPPNQAALCMIMFSIMSITCSTEYYAFVPKLVVPVFARECTRYQHVVQWDYILRLASRHWPTSHKHALGA